MGRGLFQPLHLLLILFIVLVIFGPGKLPQLGESLGKTIRGFKKAISDDKDENKVEAKKEETKP